MTFENEHSRFRNWIDRIDEIEDSTPSIAAAGMAADFGMVQEGATAGHRILGKFIELSRRSRRLTVEDLARQADLDLGELVELETGEMACPEPRSIYQLSRVFDVPTQALMELSGLAVARQELNSAALRFAARAEPMSDLSEQERAALEELVRALVHPANRS